MGLVEAVAKHNPRPSATMQRYKLNSRSCQAGKSMAGYVVALHTLSMHCEFGDTLNDMLQDRLIWSISHARV